MQEEPHNYIFRPNLPEFAQRVTKTTSQILKIQQNNKLYKLSCEHVHSTKKF